MARHATDRSVFSIYLIASLVLGLLVPTMVSNQASPATTPGAISITPSQGSSKGDTPVEISGTDFTDDVNEPDYVADVYLESTAVTLSYKLSMSFTVSSITSIAATISAIAASSRSDLAVEVVVVFADGNESRLPYTFLKPTLSSVSPTLGSSSGGTAITLSGTGFYDGGTSSGITILRIGDETITDFTVVSDTVITASIPARSGTGRIVGSQAFTLVTGITASGAVSFDFVPVREASKDGGLTGVNLGDLASRSKGKLITRSATAPFFVDGIDSVTSQPYRYRTNAGYTHNPNSILEKDAYKRESTIVTTYTINAGTAISTPTSTVAGKTGSFIQMDLRASCTHNNQIAAGAYSFCSVFGPEFYTETFYATAGQNISFEWYAAGVSDDYEFYAYLVSVSDDVNIPVASTTNHTVVAHAMGYLFGNNFWETTTAAVPSDGLYRFRFVNGSYDGTGGKVLGSTVYVNSLFTAGLANSIDFGPISDQTGIGETFTAPAQASSSNEVTVTSATPSKCTVTTAHSSPVTTVTITKVAAGTCTLNASQGSTGGYAAAETKVVSFQITADPAPNLGTYSPSSYSLTVGSATTIAAPNNSGGAVVTWSVTPALPSGLSINTTSGVISGTPTTVQAFVLYTVYAANGSGSTSAVISIEVIPVAQVPIENSKPQVPYFVTPNRVFVEGGETVVFSGQGFANLGEELFIGGLKVAIISSTRNEIRFVMPSMAVGIYDLKYQHPGMSNFNFQNAITVIERPKAISKPGGTKPITESPAANQGKRPWRVKVTVNPFAPGRSELTPELRSMIRQHVRTYAKFATQVECVGFTMGPTVLRVDSALSLARAKAICDYISVLRPRLQVTTIGGRQDRIVADRVRRVEVEFIRPASN